MGQNPINVDLARFSQKALPVAKKYDTDGNKTLSPEEYKAFMDFWSKNNTDSPLLMQLHMDTLNEDAYKIAQQCDKDEYKGVLTEDELKEFMDLYEKSGLVQPFKEGTTVKEVLTGEQGRSISSSEGYKDRKPNILNQAKVRERLFTNWLKLDIMEYIGSDKFFHAVGNFEAMQVGAEETVEKVCAGQDQDKRENCPRPEADYTEDLYANWLGREFAKMYPDKDAHDVFADLAPTGFDVEKSKKSAVKLTFNAAKGSESWLKQKFNEYFNYLKVDYIADRFVQEIKDSF